MINPGILYKVTGRYMDGQNVIGYHLVGEDDSQSKESKDRVIYLIGKGIITNMRVQIGTDDKVIIRGKGVNLNNLPVYDIGKDKFRNSEQSQIAAHSNVSVPNSNAAQMGQYRIVKRIMLKNKCLGYEVQDYTGALTRKKRSQVIQLATQRLLSNAIVQKYQKDAESTPELILRGVGCDLTKLPVLIVDENNNIIDPTLNRDKLSVRATYMKHGGILHDTLNNKKIPFKAGEFLVYNTNGIIDIIGSQIIKNNYTKSNNTSAICDDYLSFASKYYIEVFGSKPVQLNDAIIKKWVILDKTQ